MFEAVFILCSVTSMACAAMLVLEYRRTRSKILLWSALCFVGLALNNLDLLVDLVVLPTVDIDGPFWRNLMSSLSGTILLFGLIWEIE